MVTQLLNKTIAFLKESYPPKLRGVILVIFILALSTTWIFNNYQLSKIGEHINIRQAEIEIEYQSLKESAERSKQEAQRSYEQCKATSNQISQFNNPCRILEFFIGIHSVTPLNNMLSVDPKLKNLEEFKKDLESGFYYLAMLLMALVIVVMIPTARLILLISKMLWSKCRTVIIAARLESIKMSIFQKYSLILSALILITLITIFFVLVI